MYLVAPPRVRYGRDLVIAVRGREREVGRGSFKDAIDYALRAGEDEGPVSAWCHGVTSLESAWAEMEAVAQAHPALAEAVYHLIISWSPGEVPTFEQAREAALHTLRKIGFRHPQFVAALHNDGEGGCYHLHVIANRRDAVTNTCVNLYDDYKNMMASMRELEVKQGWRRVKEGERTRIGRDRYHAHRRFIEYVRRDVREVVAKVLQERPTWTELHRALHEVGCRYEVVRENVDVRAAKRHVEARIVSVASGIAALVREVGTTHAKLCDKLGAFVEQMRAFVRPSRDTVSERAREIVAELQKTDVMSRSWAGLHRMCASVGLVLERTSRNSRLMVADMESGASVLGGTCGMSKRSLERLIGAAFESSEQSEKKEGRRRRQEAREDRAIGRKLEKDPTPVIDSLTERQATFSVRDLDDDLATRFRATSVIARVRAAVVKACSAVRAPESRRSGEWGLRLTAAGVQNEERRYTEVARELARSGRMRVVIGAELRDVARIARGSAEQERKTAHVARVLTSSSANIAALRAETGLSVGTVTGEIARLRDGAAQLGPSDVVVIADHDHLGTPDALAICEAVMEMGASVVICAQREDGASVQRGESVGPIVSAMDEAGRQIERQMKRRRGEDAAIEEALRAREIALALERARIAGGVRASLSRESTREAVVATWRDKLSARDGNIVVREDGERKRINASAREAWRNVGGLEPTERQSDVMDGRLPFAVGDRIVMRERVPGTPLRPGSAADVEEISGSVWSVACNGERYRVNVAVHPGIQHRYATVGRVGSEAAHVIVPGDGARDLLNEAGSAFDLHYCAENFRDGLVSSVEAATAQQMKLVALECEPLARSAQILVRQYDDGALVGVAAREVAVAPERADDFSL